MGDNNGEYGGRRRGFGLRTRQIYGHHMNFRDVGMESMTGTAEAEGSGAGVFPYTFPFTLAS